MKVYEVWESTGWEIHSGAHVVDRTTDPVEAENLRDIDPDMRYIKIVEVR